MKWFPLKRTALALLATILATISAPAADPALVEIIPDGVRPDARQQAWAEEVASQVIKCIVRYDEAGNIENLYVSNHSVDIPEGADKRAMEARPGVSDGTFAKAKFLPGLKRLRIIKQSLSDDTIIEILEGQRDLVKFGIETHTGDNSARFMPAIAGMDQLEWLELKHLFQLGATQVDAIGPLPSLVRLELDNASAQREALTFLKDNPQVIDFEIHRSGLNNAQVGEMVDALPKLRRLGLKPTGSGFDAGALAHVAELDELEVLALWSFPEKSLFWEDGVEHLAGMKKLSRIETNGGRENWPALRQLKELRPDIEIGGGKRIILEYDSSWMGHE